MTEIISLVLLAGFLFGTARVVLDIANSIDAINRNLYSIAISLDTLAKEAPILTSAVEEVSLSVEDAAGDAVFSKN